LYCLLKSGKRGCGVKTGGGERGGRGNLDISWTVDRFWRQYSSQNQKFGSIRGGRLGGKKVEEKIDMFRTNTRIFRSPKPKTSIFKQRKVVLKI
jgi:hypothetical protein